MEDIIIIAILAIILILAGYYIYKSKKNGNKCIGCPYGSSCCKKSKEGCCSCSHTDN